MKAKRPTRTLAAIVTAMLPLSAVPALAHADAAMDTCIKAFVNSNLEKERPVKVRKASLLENHRYLGTSKDTIYLTARTTGTRRELATATCVVDGDKVQLTSNGKTETTATIKIADARAE